MLDWFNRFKNSKANISLMEEKNGFLRIDMHVHTKHSDGMSKVESLIKKARKKNIGFAITDHNTISGVIEAYKLKKKSDIIIPGIELHSKEGPHFLIYFKNIKDMTRFYEEHVKPNKREDPFSRTKLSIKDIAQFTKNKNYLVAIAHPFGMLWANIERALKKNKISSSILKKFDAAEVISGQMTKKINNKSLLFSTRYGLGKIGGSDAHSLVEFGRIITIAQADDMAEFLQKIKKKETFPMGNESQFYRKTISNMNMVRKHLKYAKPYLKNKMDGKLNSQIENVKLKKKQIMAKINKLKKNRKDRVNPKEYN